MVFEKGHAGWNKGISCTEERKNKIKENAKTNPNFGNRGKYKNIYFLGVCRCGKIIYGNHKYCSVHCSLIGNKHGYQKGHHPTDGFKNKHSINNGIPKTEEHIRKIVESRKNGAGYIPWNKGVVGCFSDETIERKSKSLIEAWKTEENRRAWTDSHIGYKPTDETILKTKGKRNSPDTEFKKGHLPKHKYCHGKRFKYFSPLQDKVCFRSSYELAYAKWLDEHKILWLYETKKFELSDGSYYFPDFYLVNENTYVEIKGYLYRKAKIKIETFRKEYPNEKLNILFYENLKELGCI